MTAATSGELRLLVRLVCCDDDRARALLAGGGASLERLAAAAEDEGFAVVLLRAVERLELRDELSPTRLEGLERRRERQQERSALLLDALAQIASRCRSAGQRLILLKGPYLAARFYDDIEGREYVDLDLLVPGADRARASGLLRLTGYERRSRVVLGEAVTGFFVHAFDYAAGPSAIDLHWRLTRHPSVRIDEARIWNDRRSFSIDGQAHDVLEDRHEVVFQALSLLRDIERGRAKVKNLIDLIQVVRAVDAGMDWDGLLEEARSNGTRGPLVNTLALCLDIGDAFDLAPRLAASLERHRSRRVAARPSGDPLSFAPTRHTIGNKIWSARVHDTTVAAWALWWMVSLPFRLAVHGRPPRPQADRSSGTARS